MSYLNMARGRISDFVSFPFFGFNIHKTETLDFESN